MVKNYTYLEIWLKDLNQKYSLSELEKYFKINHQTIKSHLKKFIQEKIIIEEKKEKFLFYILNLKNPLTYEHLIICQKEKLFRFLEKNTLFLLLYKELSPFFEQSKILLFGSSTEKKDYNDIDLLVISKNQKIKQTLNKFQQTYSKKIHLIQTQKKDITKTLINEIKQKHIIFNNHEYFMELLYK